jgi:hypothetical protein
MCFLYAFNFFLFIFFSPIGYTQGMGFIAGLLLIYMSEENAFFTMVQLMKDFELAGLYRFVECCVCAVVIVN